MPALPVLPSAGPRSGARPGRLALASALAIGLVVVAGQPAAAQTGTAQQPAQQIQPPLAAPAPPSFADLVEELTEAVVNISSSQTVDRGSQPGVPMPQLPPGSPFEEFFEEFFNRGPGGQSPQSPRRVNSLGSGFVIDPSGVIVTNNHVIQDADEIEVNFTDGRTLTAEVVGRDPQTDIAVLQVETSSPLPAVSLGDSDALRIGDWVVAIGNPFGLGGSVTAGIVSAINRDINAGPYDNFIQTDAAINRGNSGGPLFNTQGEVVGINTAIISPSGGSIGIGFSVPSSTALSVINQLREYGETRRGFIGVRIQSVTDDIAESLGMDSARGALVAGVTPGGPADEAGIEPGDVILEFNGRPVASMRELPRIVADTEISSDAEVLVLRRGEEETLTIVVERLEEGDQVAAETPDIGSDEDTVEPDAPQTAMGLTLSGMTPDLREEYGIGDEINGVVITEIEDGSDAAEKQIQVGDVIVEVAQEEVASPSDVVARVDALREEGRRSALLLLSNGQGELRFVAVAVD